MTLAPDDPRHGTANGYSNLHCRCDACREAWRIYHTDRQHRNGVHLRREDWLALLATQPRAPHGTEYSYTKLKCRCDKCRRAANAARYRRRVAASVNIHGKSGYSNGCRCDVCTAANTEYARQWRSHARQQHRQ